MGTSGAGPERSPKGFHRLQAASGYLPLAACLATATGIGASGTVDGAGAARHPALFDLMVAAAALAGLALAGVPATLRRRRAARRLLADVDAMSGVEFEARLAGAFGDLGYRVEATAGSGDYGADLLVARHGELSVVQAKRYDGTVGIKAVQEVIGARRYYGADRAMVVTNSTLTRSAVALADADDVEVVSREQLAALLAAAAVRRGGDGRWLFVHQLTAGIAVVAAVLVAVLRLFWRAGTGRRRSSAR